MYDVAEHMYSKAGIKEFINDVLNLDKAIVIAFPFSLKMECEKLATEKTEMQRHYVMYYEMSYGLNVEMHKQVTEIMILKDTTSWLWPKRCD